MKVGDLARFNAPGGGWETQQKSIALVVGEDPGGRFSIVWVGGETKSGRIRHNFHPDEFEVISEGR